MSDVGTDLGVGPAERETLLRLARASIETGLQNEDPPTAPHDGVLGEKRGAFVTLKIAGHLRGCIGHVRAFSALSDTVIRMARAAAFDDPRFTPLSADELDDLEIQISVLTPFIPVDDVSEIVVKRDGLVITKDGRSGLLLPQVAVEENWDAHTFLEHTCLKAGLPPNAWRDPDAAIERFSAQVF
jgi:AmmeMemoRadiSam system protein A